MDALILNREFQTQAIIDAFESFIWSDRYNTPGDFELYMPVEKSPLASINRDWYLWKRDTDRLMIIEDVSMSTDAEDGDHLTVTGRSLESLLDRRVIFTRTIISGSLQAGIQQLLNENAISPDDESRKIPGLRFVWNNDSRIEALTMEGNYLGEELLSVIEELCDVNDLGFKIAYNEAESSFDFSLYYGEDRSYDQDKNPWVVFSPDYDNLLGSNYYESYKNLKTAAVVAGSENDEMGQEIVDVDGRPEMTGLDRREMYVRGSDIQRPDVEVNEESIRARWEKRGKTESFIQEKIAEETAQAEAQSRADFRAQLAAKGREELAKTYITESFDGTIEAVRQYVYGRDFFIGDVVQIRNQYDKEAPSRITEVVWTHDVEGESLVPTFTTMLGGANKGDIPLE